MKQIVVGIMVRQVVDKASGRWGITVVTHRVRVFNLPPSIPHQQQVQWEKTCKRCRLSRIIETLMLYPLQVSVAPDTPHPAQCTIIPQFLSLLEYAWPGLDQGVYHALSTRGMPQATNRSDPLVLTLDGQHECLVLGHGPLCPGSATSHHPISLGN